MPQVAVHNSYRGIPRENDTLTSSCIIYYSRAVAPLLRTLEYRYATEGSVSPLPEVASVNIVRRLLPKPRRLVLQMTEVGLAQQLLRVPKPFRIPRNLERRTQGNHGHRHN